MRLTSPLPQNLPAEQPTEREEEDPDVGGKDASEPSLDDTKSSEKMAVNSLGGVNRQPTVGAVLVEP